MWRKNTWCLAVIAGIFCVMLNYASAQNISVNYPMQVDCGKTFNVDVALVNFSIDVYDIKIDITNFSGGRISEIWNGNNWQSTYNYVNDVIDTSVKNDSSFLLNVTKFYNGTASMEIKVKDSGGESETFSGYLLNVNCQSQSENGSQQNSTNSTNSTGNNVSASIDLDYASEVENGEFEVTAKLYDLQSKEYDLKVYITFEENDTIISETYSENEWKSSTYYIDNIASGPGNKTITVKLRTNDKYSSFKGNAKINARLRESASSDTVANFDDNIKIVQGNSTGSHGSSGTVMVNLVGNSSSNMSGAGLTSNVIKLNSETNATKDIKSNTVYKSKVEYFKEYGVYAFAIVCIIIIFVLLKKN